MLINQHLQGILITKVSLLRSVIASLIKEGKFVEHQKGMQVTAYLFIYLFFSRISLSISVITKIIIPDATEIPHANMDIPSV